MLKPKDWIAEFYRLLNEHGESTEMVALGYDTATGRTQRMQTFDHRTVDGFGALAEGLRNLGYAIPNLARKELRRPPSWMRLLPEYVKFLAEEVNPRPVLRWKTVNRERPFTRSASFYIFSEEETAEIKRRSRAISGNYRSFLLYHLNAAVNETLMLAPVTNRWHIPVNTRPFFRGLSETSNNISSYLVRVTPKMEPASLTRAIERGAANFAYLAAHFFLRLGDFFPLRNLLKNNVGQKYRDPEPSKRVTGSFSSFGPWPPARQRPESELIIVPLGLVSKVVPVCVCNLEWRHRLVLSLQAHSSITNGIEDVRRTMDAWLARIDEGLGLSTPGSRRGWTE